MAKSSREHTEQESSSERAGKRQVTGGGGRERREGREETPRLPNDAVDTHKVCGVGLFSAPIHIVKFCLPSLAWHALSLSVPIDTLPSW